jgi:hypothetical protein
MLVSTKQMFEKLRNSKKRVFFAELAPLWYMNVTLDMGQLQPWQYFYRTTLLLILLLYKYLYLYLVYIQSAITTIIFLELCCFAHTEMFP